MKYFGTDGIRRVAAEFFRGDFACKLARALKGLKPDASRVVIGRDTRLSGRAIEEAVSLGLAGSGVEVLSAGIVPTPAVALLTKRYGADFGIVVSASHNPPQYNGIKIFASDGYKLPDDAQESLETLIDDGFDCRAAGGRVVKINGGQTFAQYVADFIDADFSGLKIKLDCGYGAASFVAADAFNRLGARVETVAEGYEGALINVSSGSTHMRNLDARDCFLGLSFDGDADRVLAKNKNGEVLDGDVFLLLLARYYKKLGRLSGDTAVGTVLSNLALERELARDGIRLSRTAVGDIFVQREMLSGGYALGSEQSGHVILDGEVRTGDGILAGAALIKAMLKTGVSPDCLSDFYRPFPQVSADIPAEGEEKTALETPSVKSAESDAEKLLAGRGFIVIRPSGTEPKIRITVQADESALAREALNILERAVKIAVREKKSSKRV